VNYEDLAQSPLKKPTGLEYLDDLDMRT